MRAMSSVRFRSLSARRFLFCATPLLAALVLSVAAAGGRAADAAPAGPHAAPNAAAPMRFVKVRSDNAACRPDCPEWISAEGKIVTGSADALERTLNAAGGRRLPIVINSAGGAVDDAMAMGRLIRAKRLAVVVAHTTLSPCAKGAKTCGEAKGAADSRGAYCASACTLALAGGVERYVSPQSYIGVHQMTEVIKQTQVKKLYKVRYLKFAGIKLELSRHFVGEQKSTTTAKLAADDSVDYDVADYFAEMGVADPVMKLTMTTPPKSIHWMSADELRLSRLATAWVDRANPILADAAAERARRLGDRRQVAVGLAVRRQGVGAARRPDQRPSRDAGSDVRLSSRRRDGDDDAGGARRRNRRGARPARRRRLSHLLSARRRIPRRPPRRRGAGAARRAAAQLLQAEAERRRRRRQLHRRRRRAGRASSRARGAEPARRRRRPRPVRRSLPAKTGRVARRRRAARR